jgi:AcrR family transcriptional regulator
MDSRSRILSAAVEVFSQHGFRGATTRLIARRAGVNEVTIFRAFGSKERLIAQAIHARAAESRPATLPETPGNPERELIEWCTSWLEHLRSIRVLIRTCMGELEDRPAFAPDAAHGPAAAGEQLGKYLNRLRDKKLIGANVNQHAAIAMLLGACFADAMGRDIMPAMFPQPAEDAARQYTRLFLSALGFNVAARPVTTKSRRPTSHRSKR